MIRKLRVICRLYYTSGVEKDEDSESSNHGDSSADEESVGEEGQEETMALEADTDANNADGSVVGV